MNSQQVLQIDVFNDCATQCEAYAECGGYYKSAPCGCAWSLSSGKRYRCESCYIVCRERGVHSKKALPKLPSFIKEIENGSLLDQIQINNHSKLQLPILIPYQTNSSDPSWKFTNCIAVDIKNLFLCRKEKGAELNPKFQCELDVRKYFKATHDCVLIALLNGKDWMLESFWGSSRMLILKQLKELGFSICTGPTFSVTALTTEGTLLPQSHNIAMLMRHNRVLGEILEAGMSAIPNLYWVDGDQYQLNKWTCWLKDNKDVHYISRDFTSTRNWKVVEKKINELIEILKPIGRQVHILIIGSGNANASRITNMISNAGHKVSIVTSAPIMKAMHGAEYYITKEMKLKDKAIDKKLKAKGELLKNNMALFEKHLAMSVSHKCSN